MMMIMNDEFIAIKFNDKFQSRDYYSALVVVLMSI